MKALNQTILTAIICIAFVISASATTGEKKVNLRGDWKFALGDNSNFANPSFDDSKWEEVYVPSSWQEEGFSRYNGWAWYRRSFEVDFKPGEPLFIELGRIDDVDEVYINGKLIGSTGGLPPNYYTAWTINRNYLIPTEYLNKGKNIVAVRIYDEGGQGGIFGRNPGIFSYGSIYINGLTLMGQWKFRLSDDKTWAKKDIDDKGWEDVVVPSSWEDQGFREYDGFAWYRKRFTVPKDFSTKDLALLMGRIDDMDEVYLNGVLVGSTGRIERKWADDGEWERPRTYFIPENLLLAGQENVIAVRVFDQEGRGGIYEGPVTIIKREDYRDFWKRYDADNNNSGWWSLFNDWH